MKYLIFLLVLLPALISGQEIYIQNKAVKVADLVDAPTVDSIGITPDTSDVFLNVTVRLKRTVTVPSIDTTITVIDTIRFPYVLRSELDNATYNAIWNAEAKFAQAEVTLFDETAVEANLAKLNPVLIKTRGAGYLAYNRDRFGPDYVGYWRLAYNGTTLNFRIRNKQGSSIPIIEVQPGPGGTTIVPKPGGLTGTVSFYHGFRRLVFTGLIAGDSPLKVSSDSESRTRFVRREKAVEFTRLKDSIQLIPFVE